MRSGLLPDGRSGRVLFCFVLRENFWSISGRFPMVDLASQQNKTKQNAAILRAVGSITRREVGPHFVLFCFVFLLKVFL